MRLVFGELCVGPEISNFWYIFDGLAANFRRWGSGTFSKTLTPTWAAYHANIEKELPGREWRRDGSTGLAIPWWRA